MIEEQGQWRSEQGNLFTGASVPTGFVVMPKRWVDERTHVWNERDRASRPNARCERGVGVAGRGAYTRAPAHCMILPTSS